MISRKPYGGVGAALCCGLMLFFPCLAVSDGPAAPKSVPAKTTATSRIDELVRATLRKQGLSLSERCPDEVFVRRVFLDATGTLPTPAEVRRFLADPSPDKRRTLIDTLLERDEFAAYWGLKWGDLLRVKAEFPSNLWPNAVQAYDRWIRDSLRRNKPYDRFARELLTASGSNFRSPPVNFYRAFQTRTPREIAANVALVFMGIRLENSGLTDDQIEGMAAFFSRIGYKGTDEWKEEIVFFQPDAPTNGVPGGRIVSPRTPDGKVRKLPPDADPRVAFAGWLTAPGNPWFARSIVNRVWYWLLGRGLVHEPDDMRPSNPAWSPELLSYLEKELVGHAFDLKHIYRLILNSDTYQASAVPDGKNAAEETGFSHYRVRRLDAEVLLDAVNQVTGGSEKYTSSIPEPFTFLPNDQRAIELADGSIELPFLELFGRPPRNTSFESERSNVPSVFQAQHLLNSSHIQKKIEQSQPLKQLAGLSQSPKKKAAPAVTNAATAVAAALPVKAEFLDELYLRVLSRFPTAEERAVVGAYLQDPKRSAEQSVYDVAWALINSTEFLVRH